MRSIVAMLAISAALAAAAPAAAQQPPSPAPAAPPAWAPYPYGPPLYPAPSGWSMPPMRATERRSEGLRISGIVLFTVGGVATVVGVGVLVAAMANPCANVLPVEDGAPVPGGITHGERVGAGGQALSTCDGGPSLGLGILAGGVLGSLLGVPLFVMGNARVRVRAPWSALAPEIRPRESGADLRWTF